MPLRRLVLALVLWAGSTPLAAQRITVEGNVEHPAVRELRAIIARGNYQVISRDTVLPAAWRLPSDLLVVGATVRLEGSVDGSIGVLNGTLFLRPGSRVMGPIAAAGGFILPSKLATHGDTLLVPLDVQVSVRRAGESLAVLLTPPPPPPTVETPGLFGLGLPEYNRVNGLSPRASVDVRLRRDTLAPVLRGSLVYHLARNAPGGSLALTAPMGGRAAASLAAGRETFTNEAWIRGPLANTAAALFVRSDARNYHESDFVAAGLRMLPDEALVQGEGFIAPRVEVRASRDRSLRARSVFSVFGGGPWRPNPDIREGTLISGTLAAAAAWRGATARARGDASVEVGRLDPEEGSPEPVFAQLVLDGRWDMMALRGHLAAVRTHLLMPLGGRPAPPQRWSFVGGTATLPTLDYDARRGDHLVFVESTYSIPLRGPTLPLLGVPSLAFQHAVGSAWVTGTEPPRWAQNLGAGLQFSLASVFVYVDPARGLSPTLSVGLTLP